jgi:hypothetical protein
MRKSFTKDPVNPVLSDAHLIALDRRVIIILQAIRECLTKKSPEEVINFDEL